MPAVGQQQRFRHFFAQLRRQEVRILIIKDSLPIVLYILSPFDLYSRVHLLTVRLGNMLKILILLLPAFLLIIGIHQLAKLHPTLVIELADVSFHQVLGGDLIAAD